MLAAGASATCRRPPQIAAGLVGGIASRRRHALHEAGARVLINTSPEPFSNWAASVTEDVAVFAAIWTAVHHPALWLAAARAVGGADRLAAAAALEGIRRVLSSLARWFGFGAAGHRHRRSRPPARHGSPGCRRLLP